MNDVFKQKSYRREDFPAIPVPKNLVVKKLPEFMRRIAADKSLNCGAFKDFMERFGMMYLESDFVRTHTNEWYFAFVDGDYYGAFNEYWGLGNKNLIVHEMYPVIPGEVSEWISDRPIEPKRTNRCTIS